MRRYETMTKEEIVNAYASYLRCEDNSCFGCYIHNERVNGSLKENICGAHSGTCTNIITNYLNEEVDSKKFRCTKESKKLDKETQQFIKKLKSGKTVREALKEMTYGYEDENGDYQVNSYDLVLQFFTDYLNCCDVPGYKFKDMINFKLHIDVQECLHPVTQILAGRSKNEDSKYEDAMASVMLVARVRNEEGNYCNGFSELIEEE